MPYAVAAQASGSNEILRIALPAELPTGEYTFYAAAMRVTGFVDEVIGNVVQTSFIFANEAVPVVLTFADTRLPDGVIGRSYRFAIEPETGTPPYQFNLSSGTLPDGLTLGSESGLIQGEPTVRDVKKFTVQVVDASGNVGEIKGAIKVFGLLSFGEHGTYKGCKGLQEAFNLTQDLDDIRIEQGTYECNGLSIPSSKTFEYGIKISGGWDSGFVNQSDDPAMTVFDGKEEGGILSVSAYGSVAIKGFSFKNGHTSGEGGAIDGKVNITHCVFTDNSASRGGAVSGADIITNSIFTNNSASENGGAVYSSSSSDFSSSITNSTFTNNSASENGGAVYSSSYSDSSSITNSTFTNNSASDSTIYGRRNCTIVNSTIANNSGGGFKGSGTILNSIFAQNKVGGEANDITPTGDLHVDYTLANYISGAVDLGTHIIMGEPRFVDAENGNLRLRADSPAIDVGDSSVVTACSEYDNCESSCYNDCDDRYSEECKKTCCQCVYSYRFLRDNNGNALDLDGNPRIVGGGVDLGAYEVQ